ncbi:hypothetical protein CHS0354_011774 [Potamilus streckersoni]|uniref:ABC transporter domain-containing protein n=1 Tax=Potamilus streckersoni TaxID=2493646 RepID=A0AAE0WE17_9BIVA|nr:hypothetical protein CHS0354_011774 [Potamilus streckersoni]
MSTIVSNLDSATCVPTILSPKLVLEAESIHIAINDVSILSDVSIVAHSGELFTVMGPSGSGKTTLLNTIAGRRRPQSGFIKLNGNVMDKKLRRRLGFVLQEDTFFASLTLKETLYFTAMIRLPEVIPKAEKLQQIHDLSEILGVRKCWNTISLKSRADLFDGFDSGIGDMFNPGLSGGEKKRASIICELLTNPDILLLDTPSCRFMMRGQVRDFIAEGTS